jgi:hypothetical protein
VDSTSDKPISVVEAARTLYRTTSPSDEQLLRVCRLMQTGALQPRQRAGSPMTWTTTSAALADFLAHSAVQRCRAAASDLPATVTAREASKLSGVYREIWRDYFLAILMRQRADQHGATFRRAVVVGQVVALFTLVSVFLITLAGVRSFHTPAAQKLILRQIDASTDEFSVTRWHQAVPAPEGEGQLVRIEYRYRKDSSRWVYTDRTFHVAGEQVVELSVDESP